MKFAQQLASQTVPEWHEAYMNYDHLKSILVELHRFKFNNRSVIVTPPGLKRKLTLYRAFSGFTRSYTNPRASPREAEESDDQVLLVKAVQKEATSDNDRYESTFLMANEEGGEYELVFFRRLDDEFNKVVKFYKEKVKGVMNRAAVLNKQMDALIAFRNKVEVPDGSIDWSVEMSRLRSNVSWYEKEGISSSPNSDKKAETAEQGRVHMDAIEEVDDSQEENPGPVSSDSSIRKTTMAVKLPPLEILDRVKFNSTQETPRSTIKGILKKNNGQQLNFKKEELSKIEEKLKLALIAFYNELQLLKSYSSLNLMAFSKILKKYDKITSRDASKTYLKMIDKSYLGTSDEVNSLMERVEGTFIKHFAQSNRRKGLDMLRPKAKKERHRITFSLGFFSGCTASLVVALVLVIRLRKIVEEKGASQYMENLFPLYSLFGFIVLHILMYATDIYFWRRYRINYPFIFGFKQGTELNDREVLLLGTGLATLALGSVLSNLDMEMDSKTKDYQAFTELLPLVLVTLVLLIMFCPFNIIYRSSRWFLLTCTLHCLCAPLYKVTLPDFFLADQITSQVQAIRDVEFYICYYGWGDFKHRQNTCKHNAVYQTFNFIIATIPYWWRLFQCLRRFYEEKDSMQGYNGLKYFSIIIAVCMRTAYMRRPSVTWRAMAWSSSAIAAAVSTYWDLVIDWGLLQRHSRNPWLRDKLLISHQSVYFGAMVANVLLRLAWIQTVLNFKVLPVHREALITIVASLEIIRRGIWNFFRLENEHLNNVENYRAIKAVPLPFNYVEKEDD